MGSGGGTKSYFSDEVNLFKNDGLMIMPVQPEPVSPCIPMAEGGLATTQIARKQASNTEI